MLRALVLVMLMVIAAIIIVALMFGAPPSEAFTNANAVLVVGYLLYPVLTLIGPVLLVVALLFVVGAAIERRRPHEGR